MTLSFERWYPIFFAVAAGAMAWIVDAALPGKSDLTGLLSAAISASAIFVGFIATSKSILMALPTGGIRQQLHDSGFKHDLASYLNQAMISNLVFCAFNIIGFFPIAQEHLSLYSPLWIGLGILCLASFWRVSRVMTAILRLS